ncbi:histidine phosphatase family protein [Kibdelosporangium philippinense]|uniref:Histidine phosphatase family protein n=1 Tax=Kibdelosporangium philippinense TaxID=211113 RepID=A0ABS8Z913_9PSEU|nr:histidine phosphatase family protein [Kibdelosporangium philippinense]MCE7004379.1 histidine phosphatase family protein [Kibdelosporangium philippinense]
MIVHLIRHGETSSYATDAGLTSVGIEQAASRGKVLRRTLPAGASIQIGYAPTQRTRQTATVLRASLRNDFNVGSFEEMPEFRNLQVRVDGVDHEPTQVRAMASIAGERGWAVEARRFWEAHERGDAMGFWLATPLLWHESPANVVARFVRGAVDRESNSHLVVATHSGCMRAIVAWAWGRDPGEPANAEEVTLTTDPDRIEVTFRDITVNLEIPGEWVGGAEMSDGYGKSEVVVARE